MQRVEKRLFMKDKDGHASTRKKRVLIGLGLFAVFVVGIAGFKLYPFHRDRLKTESRMLMDTVVTIHAMGPEKITGPAMDRAFQRMAEVDAKFNIHNPDSPIHAFNRYGTPITDPEILGVVRYALDISRRTEGAFDITVSPLIDLWGFYDDAPRVPETSEIDRCMERIGYEHLVLEEDRLVKTRPDIRIDLGAIAKGHAIARTIDSLKSDGVTSALVDAGGDVYALGRKGSRFWHVGIKGPRREKILGYLEAEDTAVVGSGDYERFFTRDGVRYHHIFDPRTGYPAEGGMSGITLVSPDPMAADGWATALFVLGPVEGMKMADSLADIEVVMVTTSGEILLSSGLRGDALQKIPKTEQKEDQS